MIKYEKLNVRKAPTYLSLYNTPKLLLQECVHCSLLVNRSPHLLKTCYMVTHKIMKLIHSLIRVSLLLRNGP